MLKGKTLGIAAGLAAILNAWVLGLTLSSHQYDWVFLMTVFFTLNLNTFIKFFVRAL